MKSKQRVRFESGRKKNLNSVIKTCYSDINVLLATPLSAEAIYGGQIKSWDGIPKLHHYSGKK
jgi:hypothetical protein